MSKSVVSKKFLYITAFFSGMSVMAIELGASRLLAPYFSSSQIIWTIIIGTIMIAMAIGNVIGGRLADKNPDPDRLYKRLLFIAVWVALVPIVGKYIIGGISVLFALFVKSNFLVWASFASCIALFFVPLLLLGTVTPSLNKYAITSLEDSGKTVGIISAMGTIGSILGTFLPTFVTIPFVGTAMTFLIFALVLSLLCFVYGLMRKRLRVRAGIITAVIMGLFFIPGKNNFAFWQSNITHEDESVYNYLQVSENDRSIWLSTNVLEGVQSIKMKQEEFTGMYYDYALVAPALAGLKPYEANADTDMLILGLGTGTYADLSQKIYGDISIEGVEIDKKIIDLSSTYFQLSDRVKTIEDDGRAYLQSGAGKEKKYDIIMVDAYQDITIPAQMSSQEFFSLVKQHLKPNGVMVVNMNMYSIEEDSLNQYLTDTISSVFDEVAIVDTQANTNRILYATSNVNAWTAFDATLGSMQGQEKLQQIFQFVNTNKQFVKEGNRILTDDKAPVELLGMKMIDKIIEKTLVYYRTEFEGKGLPEIWSYITT